MNVTVEFIEAPGSAEWGAVLAEDGWKVTHLSAQRLSAEMVRGNSATYPPRQELRWYIDIVEDDDKGLTVSVEVPAFTDCVFSKQRLLDTLEIYVDQLEGQCETSTTFDLALLERLRN